MTPVPLDLPLPPPEAAELASLVFSLAERKPLNDEVRSRVAARTAALRLKTIYPFIGSLERDPVHHSTYYLAVDSHHRDPWLLHMASAAAPTSAIFRKPLLIGRMRRTGGPEIVVNAVPFGSHHRAAIDAFVTHINQAFLPRAQGARAALVAAAVPTAFEGFRSILKSGGRNLAAIEIDAGAIADSYYGGLWAAIRTGWREGYSAGLTLVLSGSDLDQAREAIRLAVPLTRYTAGVGSLVGAEGPSAAERFGAALQAAERLHEIIRQTRAAAKINRPFDFELSLDGAATPTTPEQLGFCLDWLKERGHAAQLAAPQPGASLADLVSTARRCQCTLSFAALAVEPGAVARAAEGRVNLRLADSSPEGLGSIARQFRG